MSVEFAHGWKKTYIGKIVLTASVAVADVPRKEETKNDIARIFLCSIRIWLA